MGPVSAYPLRQSEYPLLLMPDAPLLAQTAFDQGAPLPTEAGLAPFPTTTEGLVPVLLTNNSGRRKLPNLDQGDRNVLAKPRRILPRASDKKLVFANRLSPM